MTTPYKSNDSSSHFSMDSPPAAAAVGTASDTAMDESSVLSSPPRSAASRGRISLFFGASDNDEGEEGEHHGFGMRRISGGGTPRTRCLFPEEGDGDRKPSPIPPRGISNNIHRRGENVNKSKSRTSPPPSASSSSFFGAGEERRIFGASLSMDEAEVVINRKRSSAERRGEAGGAPSSPRISPNSFMTMDGRFVQSKNPFSSPMMTESDTTPLQQQHQHHSVLAAPQLPADEPFLKATEARLGLLDDSNDGFNVDDCNSNNHTGSSTFFPPRQRHALNPKRLEDTSPPDVLGLQGNTQPSLPLPSFDPPPGATNTASPLNGGFPDKRFSFTGSPIPEDHHTSRKVSAGGGYPHPHGHNSNSPEAMETDAASCGSLHKVRRLNLNDDVVSASGHELRSRVRPNPLLQVDTSAAGPGVASSFYGGGRGGSVSSLSSQGTNGSSMGHFYPSQAVPGATDGGEPTEDISPTDVMSFPTPPTPSKAKNNPAYPYNAYNTLRKPRAAIAPPTPVAERRRAAAQAARTPHPGSMLHHHTHNQRLLSPVLPSASSASMADPQAQFQQPASRFYTDFDVISELGQGAFGSVFRVLSRLDGCMYAIKAAKRQAKGPAERDRMLKEVYALAALSDQADTATFHIVRYHQAWMEEDRLYIQTELCQGSLADEMAQGVVPMTRRYKLLREICLALEFLVRNSMVHLDIKKDNIFVKNDQFKLGDFGLVSKLSSHQDVEEGDSRYMSKELLAGDHGDLSKSDIFGLGATVYEICLGRTLPMNGDEWQNIRSGRIAESLHHIDGDMVLLLQDMMQPEYRERPSAAELLKRPQLLSDEQKALMAERTKAAEANLALQKFQLKSPPPMPSRRVLTRANTWNGQSINTNPYL